MKSIPEAFPVGTFIQEELHARGWSQKHLAEKMDIKPSAVNRIISGHKKMTAKTAMQLADVFGTSAKMWMELDSAWQLWLEKLRRERLKK